MRLLLAGTAFFLCAFAPEIAAQQSQFDNPAYSDPSKSWDDPEAFSKALREQACRNAIEKVRAESGKQPLNKAQKVENEPLLIKAVDLRIDDCSVLVMNSDTQDIRPIPKPDDGKPIRRVAD